MCLCCIGTSQERWRREAGRVTACLAESNDSLLLGLWLTWPAAVGLVNRRSAPESKYSHRVTTTVPLYNIWSCRVCLSVCVSVFRIFEKRADLFPWNFSWFIGVICRRERIKTFGKFRPLMCKNAENGAKLPISTKYSVQKLHGATALASRASCARLRWPVVRFWETAPGQRAWDNNGEI